MDEVSHVDNLIALEDHCFHTSSATFSISSIRVLFETALALPSSSRGALESGLLRPQCVEWPVVVGLDSLRYDFLHFLEDLRRALVVRLNNFPPLRHQSVVILTHSGLKCDLLIPMK